MKSTQCRIMAVAACLLLVVPGITWAAQPGPPAPTASINDHGLFFYAADYGQRLSEPDQPVTVWWRDATRKVPRKRVPPIEQGSAVMLESAGNEFEAAQIVVQPGEPMTGLTARVSELVGPDGVTIGGRNVQILRVGYVRVNVPTDQRGLADQWPDPLPPLDEPIDVPADENQPLWLLVHVPKDASPGDYHGTVNLTAEGFSSQVPVRLHVWGFTLPDQPFTQSSFGLSLHRIAQYHGLKTVQDKQAVFAKYLQSFADHRISPYDPVPLDPIRYAYHPEADPPRCDLDAARFDAAMSDAITKYHFTTFMLHPPGMGGGTFHKRVEGQLAGFKAGTPQYEAMMRSLLGQLQNHLADRGWLNTAYIYWFDEPAEKDYPFVREGMDRLKKFSPQLRRMLTEEPAEALFDSVNLWCPMSHHFDPAIADQRMDKGDQFWWYICTGPKQPYCTLFIDHPATALRVWLWQTWQRRITGILIWETVYWTSPTAFPDSLQNPYADGMAYRTGYGQQPGTKAYWGNGDGRFLYPPLSAAAGSDQPILDGPVSSLRWEILRDGVEDVDYLYLLKAAIDSAPATVDPALLEGAKALLDVPSTITRSMADWTFDSRPIYEQRRKVAEMIERLAP